MQLGITNLKFLIAMSAAMLAIGLSPFADRDVVAPARPDVPRATVDITMPVQTGTVRNIAPGDSRGFQNALRASKCGDTIVLQAGSVYRGSFAIPNVGSCSGWVVVESSNAANLPSGTRVGPSSVSNMATLSTVALAPALQFSATGIHNFRFIGLEISCATGVCDAPHDLNNGLVEISGGLPSTVAETPNNIIIDRCYIHGSPTQNIRRGVTANGTNIAVLDSYINEIHEAGAATGGDSQAVEDWSGAGPLLIQNNFLEAASENIMFGGARTRIPGLIPSDITIEGNYFYKDLSWRGKPAPYNWVIKDSLEFKNAQRVLVHGNVFSNCWLAGQIGELIELTPRSVNGDTWATAADMTFTDNLLEHAAAGFIIAGSDNVDVPTSQPSQKILIQNNVLTDIATTWGNGTGGGGWAFLIEDIPAGANPNNRANWHDLIIDHNDIFTASKVHCAIFTSGGKMASGVLGGPFQFTNNIMDGDLCGQAQRPGQTSIGLYYHDVTWNKNVLIESRGMGYSKETVSLSKISDLRFEEQSSGKDSEGAFHLLTSSPFHNAGTDGKDIGVSDWNLWKAATSRALDGRRP